MDFSLAPGAPRRIVRRVMNGRNYGPTSTAQTPPKPPEMKDLMFSAVDVPCCFGCSADVESL